MERAVMTSSGTITMNSPEYGKVEWTPPEIIAKMLAAAEKRVGADMEALEEAIALVMREYFGALTAALVATRHLGPSPLDNLSEGIRQAGQANLEMLKLLQAAPGS